jgi:two-component system, sensor histidine kinase ChiS
VRYKILLIFIPFLMISGCQNLQKEIPKAQKGNIDLSEWNFKKDGNLKLDGEWKFYWEKLIDNEAAGEYDADFVKVPNSWNRIILTDGKRIGGYGYSTYRLGIKGCSQNDTLKIYFKDVATSYRVLVDGKVLFEIGKVGTSRSDYTPKVMPFMKSIPKTGKDFELTVQMSNFHFKNGGFGQSVLIGTDENIERYFLFDTAKYWFMIGIFMIIGCNHIFLFAMRRKDRANLFFGLFCIIISVRTISVEGMISILFPDENLFKILLRLEYVGISLAMTAFLTFFRYIFHEEINKKMLSFFQAAGILYGVVVLLLPSWFIPKYTLTVFHVIIVAAIFYCLAVLIGSLLSGKNVYAFVIFFSCVILAVTMINDIAFGQGLIRTGFLMPYGLLVFIIAQSLFISYKFTSTLNKYEDLTVNLEKKVADRTNELRSAKEKIERYSEQRTNYFINFAHETKTPVTIIKNFYDRYVERHNKADLDVLGRNIDRLKENLLNFLTAEKINSGTMNYYHKNKIVDLSLLIRRNSSIFLDLAKLKDIDVSFDIDDGIYIEADANALKTLINNIVGNAVKYTGENGKVVIKLKLIGDKLEFSVKDTGVGIDEENVKNLFVPFYQIRKEKENRQGFGFGLFIAKYIVDSLGGKIEIESCLKKGTEFKVILGGYDLKDDDFVENVEIQKRTYNLIKTVLRPEVYEKDRKSVLIVEDNLDVLEMIQDKLSEKYNVFYATNGKEASDKLGKIPFPDLIVSDIMMDVMDGIDFFKKIKSDVRFKDIPFIFLSAKSSLKLEGLLLGAVDFIEKPFNMPELMAKIDSLLNVQKMKINYQKLEEYEFNSTEKKIIGLMFEGLQNKEIASELDTTENYVKKLVTSIYKKTKSGNRQTFIKKFM